MCSVISAVTPIAWPSRLVSFADQKVTFRWRDSAHKNEQRLMTLSLDEFLRRFLLHLLPDNFVRIRNFGFLANRRRATFLPLCFALLGSVPQTGKDMSGTKDSDSTDLWLCPKCAGPMVVVERLTAAQIQLRSPPLVTAAARNNPFHRQNSACFAALRRSSPYRRTKLFFRLPRCLPSRHFLEQSTFKTHRAIYDAPLDSPGASRRQPLPTFNSHRARVRRAGGLLQVAVSKARQNVVLPSSPSEKARFRYSTKTSD
jgi:hypothetical protein